jgi:hypothetical protein
MDSFKNWKGMNNKNLKKGRKGNPVVFFYFTFVFENCDYYLPIDY